METDVYLFCNHCNEITKATGCGDSKDLIYCNQCKKDVVASLVGSFEPYTFAGSSLDLYLPITQALSTEK